MKIAYALLPALAVIAAGTAVADPTPPKPKLSMAEAEAIALKTVDGKIAKEEYEFEDGIWRYSFDINVGTVRHEVGVDSMTGKVVESSIETGKDND